MLPTVGVCNYGLMSMGPPLIFLSFYFFWSHCYKRSQNYLIWEISYVREISNRPEMITGILVSHTEMPAVNI